jgi:oxygen-dependent protoporphyrinogen oxidase
MNSCFPYFKMLEEKHGSVTKGLLKEGFKAQKQKHSLFSLNGGVQTILDALEKQLKGHIHFKEEVTKVNVSDRRVEVQTTSGLLEADLMISALPAGVWGKLFQSKDKEIAQLITSIRSQGLLCVNLGFKEKVLHHKGFGYLVPTSEKQQVYGAIFDSSVFPQHNRFPKETRLTVMAKENTTLQTLLSEIKHHLKISATPDFVRTLTFKEAIPQFDLGHKQKIGLIKEKLFKKYPACRLLGNYLTGPSVNDCIANSSQLVVNLQQELLSRP